MTMSAKEKIEEAANGDRTLYTEYSGRGMYGKTCIGIVCDDPEDVIAEVGVRGAQMDSMGRRTIVYWPKVKGD